MQLNTSFKIGDRSIGFAEPVFIIAEAGVAHFGDLGKALKLVDLACDSGADAVKFQIFNTDQLISRISSEWKDRYRCKELGIDSFQKIKNYCTKNNILFLATAHDEKSLTELTELEVPAYKIGSGEVKNWPFLRKIAQLNKPLLLSTGMYNMDDIRKAIDICFQSNNKNVAVLHCTTAYPTPVEKVNLKAIRTIRDQFNCVVGYSDHTEGFHFPVAAIAMGARIIEKHISLDFNIPNAQDWKVSCGPDNLSIMIKQIRDVEAGLGSGKKEPCDLELSNMLWSRKSIVAAREICPGVLIEKIHLTAKRPGTGIPPSDIDRIIGKKAKTTIPQDSIIDLEDLE